MKIKRKVYAVVMAVLIIGLCSACGKEEKTSPDVVSSMKFNRDETLTVVANRNKIEDKEEFARLLLQMCKENSFESMKFSTDEGYPTSLEMQVYAKKDDLFKEEPIMKVEYKTEDWNPDYDIVNTPDQFHLYIDGEMIAEEK